MLPVGEYVEELAHEREVARGKSGGCGELVTDRGKSPIDVSGCAAETTDLFFVLLDLVVEPPLDTLDRRAAVLQVPQRVRVGRQEPASLLLGVCEFFDLLGQVDAKNACLV